MRKVALLIGNNSYPTPNNLNYAVIDAEGMDKKLSDLGFQCKLYKNIDNNSLGDAISEFERSLPNFDVGLFYFSGHGFEVKSINCLAMCDTNLADEISIKNTSLKLQEILDILRDSTLKVKIIILDACRSIVTSNRGDITPRFAPILAPKGTIIAFSTSPGQSARDSKSSYTSALLKCIGLPNQSIENMFKRVREMVSASTKGEQISWEHTSLLGDFSFNSGTIDGSFLGMYSDEAYSDKFYMPSFESILAKAIQDLRTRDYNLQNPVYSNLIKILRDYESNLNKDDLFVLGRNLYQTGCGRSYTGQNFMQHIDNNLSLLSKEISFHILNGITFEIYFDSIGRLRHRFKSEYAEIVIELLEKKYSESLKFIVSELHEFDDQLFYIPGSNLLFTYDIKLKETNEEFGERKIYIVEQVYCKGQPVLFDESSGSIWNPDDQKTATFLQIVEFENVIRNAMAAPQNRVKFIYGNEEPHDCAVIFPIDFSLHWHT